MRRLLWASLPRMLGVTRNPSRRFVLEKPDTSFNTGNAEGFRLSPNNHPTKPGDFAWLRARGRVFSLGSHGNALIVPYIRLQLIVDIECPEHFGVDLQFQF